MNVIALEATPMAPNDNFQLPPLHLRRLDFFRKSFWLGFEATISFPAAARASA
jgi:hypothetical protein